MNSFDTAAARWTLGALLRCALAAGGVVVFFTWADNYAHLFWAGPLPVQLVFGFTGAAAAALLLDLGAPLPLARSPLLGWTCAFFLVTTAWAVWTASSPFEHPALRAYYRSLAFLVAMAIVFDDPRARRVGTVAIAGAVAFAALVNLAEFAGLVSFHGQEHLRVAGRAAGLYVNANSAGFAIVFGLAIALHRLPSAWRVPLLLLGTAGVAVTFSRGAGLCLAVLVPALVWRRHLWGWPATFACVAVAVAMATQGDRVMHLLDQGGLLTTETSARLRLEEGDSGRIGLARGAWDAFLAAPLVGNGLGATVSSHNQFLTLAGDHGLVGLALFPALALAVVLANPAALPFAVVLLVAGFFSHNLLEDRGTLLAIALAAARELRPRAAAAGAEAEAELDPGATAAR